MSKYRLNVTIDWDVYVALKNLDVNVSDSVNQFLKNLVGQNEINGEESEMQKEIDYLRKKYSEILQSIAHKSSELSALRSRNEEILREERARDIEIKESGIVRQIDV